MIYTVKLLVSEHKRPEVVEAKMEEVRNLEDYKVFGEIEEVGQETIGSQWVVIKKEKHFGQKTEYIVRLVAFGFQKTVEPQYHCPSVSKESINLLIVVAANSDFKLASVDTRATLLQVKVFDREIYMKPTEDMRKLRRVYTQEAFIQIG